MEVDNLPVPDRMDLAPRTELRSWRVRRDRKKDLVFEGWLIGQAVRKGDPEVVINIWVSLGGKLILGDIIRRNSRRKRHAVTCSTLDRALRLVQDRWLEHVSDEVSETAKTAWWRACQSWDVLHGADVDEVE